MYIADTRARTTVIAALHFWAREGLLSSGHEVDLANGKGEFEALNADQVRELAEQIESAPMPAVVVELDGTVERIRANSSVEVITLADFQTADSDNIRTVFNREYHVDHTGAADIEPEFVRNAQDWLANDSSDCPVEAIFTDFEAEIAAIREEHGPLIEALEKEVDEAKADLDDFMFDKMADLKTALGSKAANEAGEGADAQEEAISRAEAFVTDNYSNSGSEDVPIVIWLHGVEEGAQLIRNELAQD